MPQPAPDSFAFLDWAVVAAYLLAVVALGLRCGRRSGDDADEPFLAGRSMPVGAVAISVLATSLSAATFLGAPQIAYGGDLTYLSAQLGGLIAMVVVAFLFVPAFYRHGVVSVYELLGHAYGPGPRLAASGMFMLGRVLASGARLYLVAIPFALVAFGDLRPEALICSIIAIGALAALYTAVGGIRAVIWTDVMQAVVVFGTIGLVVILLLDRIPAPVDEIARALGERGKLRVLDTSTDPSKPFTIWTALIGVALLNIAAFGCDQDLTQRLLTCRDARSSARSMILATLLGVPVVALFLLVGLLLFVYYQLPDLMGGAGPAAAPDDSRQVLLEFVFREMPTGVRGLMLAGVFAAAMSSLDSALNAMASTTIADFRRHLRPGAPPASERRATRVAVVGWATVLVAFACFCVHWQQRSEPQLITFALGVMVYAYGGLLGVFGTALLTRRGNAASAGAALAVGFATALVTEPALWTRLTGLVAGAGRELPALAFTWRMTLGAGLSFLICAAGARRRVSSGHLDRRDA